MKALSKRRLLLAAVTLGIVAAVAAMGSQALAGSKDGSASAQGLGPISGLLPRDHLTEESAIQVDLSKESVRLPLYKGKAQRRDGLVRPARRLRCRGSRTTWASTTRPSSATSRSATRRPCRR